MRDVYEVLKEHGVPYEKYEHVAVFTTDEAEKAWTGFSGKKVKNLFLTNRKGDKYYLVSIAHDKRADLKKLGEQLCEKRLQFVSPEGLMRYLGLTPGSVSPLGLINDEKREVTFLLDEELLNQDTIYIHPNINTATLAIPTNEFKRFIESLGYAVVPLTV